MDGISPFNPTCLSCRNKEPDRFTALVFRSPPFVWPTPVLAPCLGVSPWPKDLMTVYGTGCVVSPGLPCDTPTAHPRGGLFSFPNYHARGLTTTDTYCLMVLEARCPRLRGGQDQLLPRAVREDHFQASLLASAALLSNSGVPWL